MFGKFSKFRFLTQSLIVVLIIATGFSFFLNNAHSYTGLIYVSNINSSSFSSPVGIAKDSSGNIYVIDKVDNTVKKFDSNENLLTSWGGTGTTENKLNFPVSITVDPSGHVYVLELTNSRIQEFESDGTFIKMFGWGVQDGTNTFQVCTSGCQAGVMSIGNFYFSSYSGIAADSSGNIYITEYGYNRVSEFDSNGIFVKTFGWGVLTGGASFETCFSSCLSGVSGHGVGQFNNPTGMAIDSLNHIYISDGANSNGRIQEFESDGTFIKMFGWGVQDGTNTFQVCTSGCQAGILGYGNGQFYWPQAIGIDSSNNVYVTDINVRDIQEFDSNGNFIIKVGQGGGTPGTIPNPMGLIINTAGYIYEADYYFPAVQKFKIDAIPVISSLSLNTIPAGSPDTTIDILGEDFNVASIVRFNGIDHTPTFIGSDHLQVDFLSASDFNIAGNYPVTVFNSSPDISSASSVFNVSDNPTVTIVPSAVFSNRNITDNIVHVVGTITPILPSQVSIHGDTTAGATNLRCTQIDTFSVDCLVDVTSSGLLYVSATNGINTTKSSAASFSIDPLFQIEISPLSMSSANMIPVTIHVTDDNTIDVGNVYDGGITAGYSDFLCTQFDPNTVNCDLNITSSGDLIISADDNVGNSVTSQTITYIIGPPIINVTLHTLASHSTISDTTIHITDDNAIDFGNITVSGLSTANTSNLNCVQTDSKTVDCSIKITSSGTLIIHAIDNAGNIANSDAVTYSITPPPHGGCINNCNPTPNPCLANPALPQCPNHCLFNPTLSDCHVVDPCTLNPSLCIVPPPIKTCANTPSMCPPPPPPHNPPPNGSPSNTTTVTPPTKPTVTPPIPIQTPKPTPISPIKTFLKTVAAKIILVTVASTALATTMASTPMSMWRSMLSFLAVRKRKPWGVVYDSITKQPLDPAYVVLQDINGTEINTAITDLDGRYGFFLNPGMYKLIANKTNYIFPSAKLQGKFSDELYDNLYFGDTINILKAGDVLAKNIPMDPMNFDWNEYAKKQQNLLHFYQKRDILLNKVSSALFYFGFILSSYAILNIVDKLNIVIFALYILIFFFRTTLLKPKQEGTVTDRDGSPLAFAIVRIFSASTHTEMLHKTTNALGKYYCLISNGHYYVKIEKHNPDDTYTPVYTSGEFEVREGVVNGEFSI